MNKRILKVLTKREILSGIYGINVYFLIFLSCIMASIFFYTFLDTMKNGIITGTPMLTTFIFSVIPLSGLYFGVSAVTSIAKERSEKTIEVLFYGPVSEENYILEKYINKMFLYCYFLSFVIIFFVLSDKFMNFGLGTNFLKVCFLSILIVSCAVSFGIFLSTLAPSENMSIVILIGFYVCMGSLLILESMLGLPTHGNINIIQNMFLKIVHISRMIDPIHYFSLGMSSISDGGKELLDFKLFKTSVDKYILSVLESTIYSVIMIVASIISMKIKGVK
ncbi:MAG: ABC transporter permease subunit [Methanomicrobia archaeon]|nr:ABC transporter permease subunit [Methanomicrobia archaeon]